MIVGLIFAQGTNGAFGLNGALPWRVKEDMQVFKQVTTGHAVIMGRCTWDSLPPSQKPLAGRVNIIITKSVLRSFPESDVFFVRSLQDALFVASMRKCTKAWVIGGKNLLRQASAHAEVACVTHVKYKGAYDVSAPSINTKPWSLTHHRPGRFKSGKPDYGHRFEMWKSTRLLSGAAAYE